MLFTVAVFFFYDGGGITTLYQWERRKSSI